MSRKSKRVARRRKRRSSVNQLDRMHQALGEFMTEIGRIEFRLLLYMDHINEAPLEAMFKEYSGETLGGKIKEFKKWCEHAGVPECHLDRYNYVCETLAGLLDTRNMLVHAETWQGSFRGKPHQPYRVAIVEGNIDYLDDLEHVEHGDNVFDIFRIREVTRICIRLHNILKEMRDEAIVDAEKSAPSYDGSDWPESSVA